MIYSFIVTCVFVLIPLLAFKKYFLFSSLVPMDLISILIMVFGACLPFILYKLFQKLCCPTTLDTIIKEAKNKSKRLKMKRKATREN